MRVRRALPADNAMDCAHVTHRLILISFASLVAACTGADDGDSGGGDASSTVGQGETTTSETTMPATDGATTGTDGGGETSPAGDEGTTTTAGSTDGGSTDSGSTDAGTTADPTETGSTGATDATGGMATLCEDYGAWVGACEMSTPQEIAEAEALCDTNLASLVEVGEACVTAAQEALACLVQLECDPVVGCEDLFNAADDACGLGGTGGATSVGGGSGDEPPPVPGG